MNLKKVDTVISKAEIENNLPYHLLRVGLTCNVNCVFCNIPMESNVYPARLGLNELKKEIDKISKKDPRPKISITGGEPTVRADLIKIIEYLKKRKTKIIELQTNAILLSDDNLVKKIKKAGLNKAFVSLHSHLPELHDLLIMQKGGFEKCVHGINNLLTHNIQVTLNPVVTSLTYKHLPGYIGFIHTNLPKISSISLSVVQPNGRAMIYKKIVPRYSLIGPYIKKALGLADKFNIVVNNPFCGLPLCIGEWHKRPNRCLEHNESIVNKDKLLSSRPKELSEKMKPRQCKYCQFNDSCNGVWYNYAKIYPISDLKPIRYDQ
ncbi:MAG: hypothetical protein A2042_04040 [Candidatus Schekmanbacteria bacterium GWA2_38_11]|uniref:Radical SAM core domain-containing protein n=1 Tax=Candidatus Schekmanbacteria bacterium GWA2_38_11 TaxID=1817876 RepID=A0A1F7RN11_9BACT|nr:MAG: hypothetical protein A2042_04040 [Candidatus Schekmanbacteria bacterium GWA2_38_11]